MSWKKRNKWLDVKNKYSKPLKGREVYSQLKLDYDTKMIYLETEGEMATKEVTLKVIQDLLTLAALPDEVYFAVKEKQDRIIREKHKNSFRKTYDKSKEEESKGKQGYVYFLKDYYSNAIKIGYAKNPRQRINNMIFVPSIPIEILHTIFSKNAQRLEQLFHHYFYKKRIKDGFNTEFFDLTEEDMQNVYIRNLPEEMLDLIIEEEYELPERFKRFKRVKKLNQYINEN